jgi:hypothetical protein
LFSNTLNLQSSIRVRSSFTCTNHYHKGKGQKEETENSIIMTTTHMKMGTNPKMLYTSNISQIRECLLLAPKSCPLYKCLLHL